MKALTVALTEEKNKLAQTGAWVYLITVYLTDGARHFVPNNASILFDGILYEAFGCKVGDVRGDLQGGLAEVEVAIQNVSREMSAYVELNDLRGVEVRLITVNTNQLADPNSFIDNVVYEINEISVSDDLVTFQLGHDRLLRQRAPYGRILRDNCRWVYNMPPGRSPECGYIDNRPGPRGSILSSSGFTITGTGGTDFMSRFIPGDWIQAGGQTKQIATVVDDTHMTTVLAFSPVLGPGTYNVQKPTCDKILEGPNGCRAHNNVARIGAFPGIPVLAG